MHSGQFYLHFKKRLVQKKKKKKKKVEVHCFGDFVSPLGTPLIPIEEVDALRASFQWSKEKEKDDSFPVTEEHLILASSLAQRDSFDLTRKKTEMSVIYGRKLEVNPESALLGSIGLPALEQAIARGAVRVKLSSVVFCVVCQSREEQEKIEKEFLDDSGKLSCLAYALRGCATRVALAATGGFGVRFQSLDVTTFCPLECNNVTCPTLKVEMWRVFGPRKNKYDIMAKCMTTWLKHLIGMSAGELGHAIRVLYVGLTHDDIDINMWPTKYQHAVRNALCVPPFPCIMLIAPETTLPFAKLRCEHLIKQFKIPVNAAPEFLDLSELGHAVRFESEWEKDLADVTTISLAGNGLHAFDKQALNAVEEIVRRAPRLQVLDLSWNDFAGTAARDFLGRLAILRDGLTFVLEGNLIAKQNIHIPWR